MIEIEILFLRPNFHGISAQGAEFHEETKIPLKNMVHGPFSMEKCMVEGTKFPWTGPRTSFGGTILQVTAHTHTHTHTHSLEGPDGFCNEETVWSQLQ